MVCAGQKILCSVCLTIALTLSAACGSNVSTDAVDDVASNWKYDNTFALYMDHIFGTQSDLNRFFDVAPDKVEIDGKSCVQLNCDSYGFSYFIAVAEDDSAVYGWFPNQKPEHLGGYIPEEMTEAAGNPEGELLAQWQGRYVTATPEEGYPEKLHIAVANDREVEVSVPDGTYSAPSVMALPYVSPSGQNMLNMVWEEDVIRLLREDDGTLRLQLLYSRTNEGDAAQATSLVYAKSVRPVPDTAPPKEILGRWARNGIYGDGSIELYEDYSFYEHCEGDYYGQGYGAGYYLPDDGQDITLHYEEGSEGQEGQEAQLRFTHEYCVQYSRGENSYFYWADVMSEDDPDEIYYTHYGTEYESAVTAIAGYWVAEGKEEGVLITDEGAFQADSGEEGRCLFQDDTLQLYTTEKKWAQWEYQEDETMRNSANGDVYGLK